MNFDQPQNTEGEDVSFEALKISNEIQSLQEGFVQQIKELCEKHPNLQKGFSEYGGIETFEDFYFPAFGNDFNSKAPLFKEGYNLPNYINSNKNKTSIENLNHLKDSLLKRFNEIIIKLNKDFKDKNQAFKEIESVHKELILPILEGGKIFG